MQGEVLYQDRGCSGWPCYGVKPVEDTSSGRRENGVSFMNFEFAPVVYTWMYQLCALGNLLNFSSKSLLNLS